MKPLAWMLQLSSSVLLVASTARADIPPPDTTDQDTQADTATPADVEPDDAAADTTTPDAPTTAADTGGSTSGGGSGGCATGGSGLLALFGTSLIAVRAARRPRGGRAAAHAR